MVRYVGIDLSTKTGLVIQDDIDLIYADELMYRYDDKVRRLNFLMERMFKLIVPGDIVAIESPSFGSKGNAVDFQYAIGLAVRERLYTMSMSYINVSPQQLKKFATGNGQVKGKDILIAPVKRRWNFEHGSDNVLDAFVLSEIAKASTQGSNYAGLKEHEKVTLRAIKNGTLNNPKIKEVDIPTWRSKPFNEKKFAESKIMQANIKEYKAFIRQAKKDKDLEKVKYFTGLLEKEQLLWEQNKKSHVKDTMDWE